MESSTINLLDYEFNVDNGFSLNQEIESGGMIFRKVTDNSLISLNISNDESYWQQGGNCTRECSILKLEQNKDDVYEESEVYSISGFWSQSEDEEDPDHYTTNFDKFPQNFNYFNGENNYYIYQKIRDENISHNLLTFSNVEIIENTDLDNFVTLLIEIDFEGNNSLGIFFFR